MTSTSHPTPEWLNHAEEDVASRLYGDPPAATATTGHDGYHDTPAALDALAEERHRAELLAQLADVRTRLDVLLEAAAGGGWRLDAGTVDELYDRLTAVRSALEEGP